MNRLRQLLGPWLAALLLLQGVAVSAAPIAAAAPAAHTATEAAPPCHGQAPANPAPSDAASCCGDQCADMTHCLLGHLAVASRFELSELRAPDERAIRPVFPVIAPAPPVLLRPPIRLHG